MTPGIYVDMNEYGSRSVELITKDGDKTMRQLLHRVYCDVSECHGGDEADYKLIFSPDYSIEPRDVANAFLLDNWHLLIPLEKLIGESKTMARDGGVLVTVATCFFAGDIDVHVIDEWLDSTDTNMYHFPDNHFVAEPFAEYAADALRGIILSSYNLAVQRLHDLKGAL